MAAGSAPTLDQAIALYQSFERFLQQQFTEPPISTTAPRN
ncbi:MAG: hypothetical protein LBU43_03790 [Candidatus Accumulibacter sp.]|nr:hypothetical protein [Accumulibacter sp.]